jgi:channel protein (hemolysin III family)
MPPVAGSLISIPGFAEPFSSISHLAGAAVFLVLAVLLVRRGRGCRWRVVALSAFGFGSVLLLSISGVYHLLSPGGAARAVLQRLDHAAIFVLIASSFMPPHEILFRGRGRWGVVGAIWAIAILAIVCKTVFFKSMPDWLSLSMYLGMGWIGLGSGIAMARRFGFAFVAPILWGGVAYSIGALLEFSRWPVLAPGVIQWHEVFHVAVLVGLAFHWAFAYSIADGRLTPKPLLAAACPATVPG